MKIIQNTYKNTNHDFTVVVTKCNKRVATTENIGTGEIVKYNRAKFEWMITKGVFIEVEEAAAVLASVEVELEALLKQLSK